MVTCSSLNLKLFGAVTNYDNVINEHDVFIKKLCSELDLNSSRFSSCSLQLHGKDLVGKTLVCLGEVVATAEAPWGQMEQAEGCELGSSSFPGNGKNALRGFSARLQKRSETPALPARGISTGAKLRGDSSDVEVVEGVQLSEESH